MRAMVTTLVRVLRYPMLLVCCGVPLTAPSAVAAEPIKVGAVLPFSGGVELYGQQARLGLNLAVKEINAAGGIAGRPLTILYEDDKTNPEVAERATRKLIERDRVLAVIGPITSQNLNAIKPTIERTRTPLLYATNYEGGACSRYVFSFGSVPNQELGRLLPYMHETFGASFFLLGADRIWPHKMFQVAEPLISRLGGQVVGKEYTLGTETDFAPLIDRIAATNAKVLLFALKGDGLHFIPQADDRGLMKQTTVAFLGLSETDLPVFQGKGQNMFVVVPFVAASDEPSVKAFVARARREGGTGAVVSNYVMTHYNALMALKSAVVKSGKVDREALVDALEGLVIPSPTGRVTVGQNHHVTMNMFLARTQGANLVQVQALGEIAPDPGCQ